VKSSETPPLSTVGISSTRRGTNSPLSLKETSGSRMIYVNNNESQLTVNNSTISGNFSGHERATAGGVITNAGTNRVGSAIRHQDGLIHLNQVTVTNNFSSNTSGGALYSDNQFLPNEGFIVENSIIFGNTDGNGAEDIRRSVILKGHNIVGSSQGTADDFATFGGTRVNVDPGLAALADNGGFGRTHLTTIDISGEPAVAQAKR
ncbi:MAG: hypothetical protein AAF242_11105, partial [Bacteroidota bacterium]